MNEAQFAKLKERLYESGRVFEYPPPPNIAAAVDWEAIRLSQKHASVFSRPRLAWVIALLLVALVGLMTVPPVRAQMLELFQIGVIRIFLREPGPAPTPTQTVFPPQSVSSMTDIPKSVTPPPTAALVPTRTPITSILELSGETTLVQAQDEVNFPIRLPAYPDDLGPPDLVFYEYRGGTVIVLVWLEQDNPNNVRLSLMQLGQDAILEKTPPLVISEVTVGDQPALWTEGPHQLQFRSENKLDNLVVFGNVLIWEHKTVTYRLEGNLSLDEAIKIAESLQ